MFLKKENYMRDREAAGQILHRFDTNPLNPILGCIPHLKLAIIEEESSGRAIVYMGSHNMTKAAWGRFEKKHTQIHIANSELGLILFDVHVQELKSWLPFLYPPSKYGSNDTPYLRHFD